MTRLRRTTLLLVLLASVTACRAGDAVNASADSGPSGATVTTASQRMLTRVESRNVCMVNDQDMGKPQIPVSLDGKTYFGCCAMCKEKLEKNPAVRTAPDPVTGKLVDKAQAVIARNDEGRVFYFESEDSLLRFAQ